MTQPAIGVVDKVASEILHENSADEYAVLVLHPEELAALNILRPFNYCGAICTLGELKVLAEDAKKYATSQKGTNNVT